MRLDKYLKVSRIIRRRTVADEACTAGRVKVNGNVAKSGQNIKIGDIIEVEFGNNTMKVEVLDTKEHTRKDDAKDMYKIIV